MMKYIFRIILSTYFILSLSSCATILGGQVSTCQKTKPAPGNPSREVRVVAMVADIFLFWPGLIVDFATGAIYKPCKPSTKISNEINASNTNISAPAN